MINLDSFYTLYYNSIIIYTILGLGFYLLSERHKKTTIKFKDLITDYILSLITIYFIIWYKIIFITDKGLYIQSLFDYIFKLFGIVIIHDIYFYFIHRLMHISIIYNISHYVHHTSKPITPFTALAFHPIEILLELGFIPSVLYFLKVNQLHFISYFILQMIHNFYIHSRLELFKSNKYIITSLDHWNHHNYNTFNYGLYFSYLDNFFGTKVEIDKLI